MMFEYDEYFEDFNEFDEQMEEFKNILRNEVKDEIRNKIESLEKEVKELKEFRDNKDRITEEYNTKIAEAQRAAREAKEKYKKARLYQLMGEFNTIGWKIKSKYTLGEKCNKCDENRKIHFTSPQGKPYVEECKCAKRHYTYFPEEATLAKFYVRKKNFRWNNDDRIDYHNRYYTVKDDDEYDLYETASELYEPGYTMEYEKINSYRAVFLSKEDCQKYCDWKNAKVKEKEE